MPTFLAAVNLMLVCVLAAACASPVKRPPSLDLPSLQRFEAARDAKDWSTAAAAARETLDAVALDEDYSPTWHGPYWRMIGVLEHVGDHRGAAAACLAIRDPDAAIESMDILREHGLDKLPPEAKETPQGRLILQVMGRCASNDFVGARQAISDRAVSAESSDYRRNAEIMAIARFVLADWLFHEEKYEAALSEFVWATYEVSLYDVDHPRAALHRTLGFVRQAKVLNAMERLGLALDAIEQAGKDPSLLANQPRARSSRDAILLIAENNRKLTGLVTSRYASIAEPVGIKGNEFAHLQGVEETKGLSLERRTFVVGEHSLAIRVDVDGVEIADAMATKRFAPYRVPFAARTWNAGLGCAEWRNTDTKVRCMRRFTDGSVFFGADTFEAFGLVLSPANAPYLGQCHFGRPVDHSLRIAEIVEQQAAAGPIVAGRGPRQVVVARMRDSAIFLGQGYIDGERLIPDGKVVLAYPEGWFGTTFDMGTAGAWLPRWNVLHKGEIGNLKDLTGKTVVYHRPQHEDQLLRKFKAEQEQERQAVAAARAAKEREDRRRSEQLAEELRESREWTRTQEAQSQAVCPFCGGQGSSYRGGGAEQYRYSVQDLPNGPSREVIGVRYTSGSMVPCTYCDGAGVR